MVAGTTAPFVGPEGIITTVGSMVPPLTADFMYDAGAQFPVAQP